MNFRDLVKKTGFYTDFDVHLAPHEMTLKKRNSAMPDEIKHAATLSGSP